MRSQEDLYTAFDSVGNEAVDPDDMLARIHAGSTAVQTTRRRRIAVASVAVAAVLIVVGATLIPSLGDERPDRGQVADSPTPSATADHNSGSSPVLAPLDFSPGPPPVGYSTESTYVTAEEQSFTFSSTTNQARPITIRLAGSPTNDGSAPELTGELITIDTLRGPLTVQAIGIGRNELGQTGFGVVWQISDGRWFNVSVEDTEDAALGRASVLSVAEQIDLSGRRASTFPAQLGFLPEDLAISGSSRQTDAGGILRSALLFETSSTSSPVLRISAENTTGVPAGRTANTSVGNYEAEVIQDQTGHVVTLTMFDVEGFMLTLEVTAFSEAGSLDEADLRQIGVTIAVIEGAAEDVALWTDQPIA